MSFYVQFEEGGMNHLVVAFEQSGVLGNVFNKHSVGTRVYYVPTINGGAYYSKNLKGVTLASFNDYASAQLSRPDNVMRVVPLYGDAFKALTQE